MFSRQFTPRGLRFLWLPACVVLVFCAFRDCARFVTTITAKNKCTRCREAIEIHDRDINNDAILIFEFTALPCMNNAPNPKRESSFETVVLLSFHLKSSGRDDDFQKRQRQRRKRDSAYSRILKNSYVYPCRTCHYNRCRESIVRIVPPSPTPYGCIPRAARPLATNGREIPLRYSDLAKIPSEATYELKTGICLS